MVYSIMQVLAAERPTIGKVSRKASPGGKVWYPTGLLPYVQAIYKGHGHLDRWLVEARFSCDPGPRWKVDSDAWRIR